MAQRSIDKLQDNIRVRLLKQLRVLSVFVEIT